MLIDVIAGGVGRSWLTTPPSTCQSCIFEQLPPQPLRTPPQLRTTRDTTYDAFTGRKDNAVSVSMANMR